MTKRKTIQSLLTIVSWVLLVIVTFFIILAYGVATRSKHVEQVRTSIDNAVNNALNNDYIGLRF